MGKIKDKISKLGEELESDFRGISKRAMATAIYILTLLLLICICVALLSSLNLAISDSMTEHAMDQRNEAIEERNEYKSLYEKTKQEYEIFKDTVNDSN
ncbi:hypothetical protein EOM57_00980 [Candidatus Saccharibacteria bacterium]|nr:hypothetical protein [Candidatus Saccharibacteria bacterium]